MLGYAEAPHGSLLLAIAVIAVIEGLFLVLLRWYIRSMDRKA